MSQRNIWWTGLLLLPIIRVVANFVMTDGVESDLAARAAAAITAGPVLDKPSVTVAGRDATPAGTAFSAQRERDAVNAAPAIERIPNRGRRPHASRGIFATDIV